MSGRDVAELWAQLKAQGAPPPGRRSGPSLSGLAGLPGITSHVRTYDKSRGPRLPEQRPSFIAQLGLGGAHGQEQHAQSTAGDHQALLVSCRHPAAAAAASGALTSSLTIACICDPCST